MFAMRLPTLTAGAALLLVAAVFLRIL